MNAGWVTFCTQKYLQLAAVMATSLIEFSKYPLEIFTSDCDFKLKDSRISNKRLDLGTECFTDVCYAKNLRSPLKTSFDVFAVIDADMIANRNCDDIMQFAIKNKDKAYPLCAGHGCDPNNQSETMERLATKTKSMPYVYSTYIASSASRAFFKSCCDFVDGCRAFHIPTNTGETMINCMLWKMNVKEQTNCWLPYIDVLPYYLKENIVDNPLYGYYLGKELSYHFWHGQKDLGKANEIFNLMKSPENKNNKLLEIKPKLMSY